MQITNVLPGSNVCCVIYSARCLEGFIKCIILLPFKTGELWGRKAESNTRGVREVVETASDKMSAAPELNPGDWKWIECISPYIDSRWHRRDSDGEWGELEGVNEWDEDEEKEHRGGRKRAVVCYQLTTGAFQTPLLSHYTITKTEGPVFTQPHSILVQRQDFWLAPLSIPQPLCSINTKKWTQLTRARGHWVSRG